eukprot:TRINITY_DN751_c0_g3_i2.p3 TRINITY_DN751_c0_g3~~TRINITY_DN751_c0_g3_i2.p3  ORF type:complete len:191 (+),score=88.83 TRINITY_DN751_c0_g3_i2:51-623(+)
MMRFAVLSTCVALATGNAVVLTKDTFDEQVFKSGKNALVKFYAPWCGHCKRMAPDYAKLGAEYEGSSVLIGDVDATIESELGTRFQVQGYPTLKYFTQATGSEPQEYNSGRDLESMRNFVEENLAVKCNVETEEGCSQKEVDYIAKMKGKGADAIAKEHTRLTGMTGKSMKADLRQWWSARLAILSQLKN